MEHIAIDWTRAQRGIALVTKAVPKPIAGKSSSCRWTVELVARLTVEEATTTIAGLFPGAKAVLSRAEDGTDTDVTVRLAHNLAHVDLEYTDALGEVWRVGDKAVEIRSCKLRAREGSYLQVTQLLFRELLHESAECIVRMLGHDVEVSTRPDQATLFDAAPEIGAVVTGFDLDGETRTGRVVRSIGGRTEIDVFGTTVQLIEIGSTITLESASDDTVADLLAEYARGCRALGGYPTYSGLMIAISNEAADGAIPQPAGGVWWVSSGAVDRAVASLVDQIPEAGEQ